MIRTALPEDLEGIYYVEVSSFRRPYDKRLLRMLLGLAGRYALVALCDGRVVGYVLAIPYVERVAHVASIAVVPGCRRRGLGSRLLQALEELLRRDGFRAVFLETWVSNTAARSFYERRGYRPLLVLPGYYEWGEDAVVYVKLLRGA